VQDCNTPAKTTGVKSLFGHMAQIESGGDFVSSVRIDLRRLTFVYSAVILIPLAIGFLAELLIDVDFSLIILAGFVSIPLAVFFVVKTALAEMERVVQLVAPSEEDEESVDVLETSQPSPQHVN